MLLRLKVKGFKSLADVEVRLGPLTCVVGPNGAGKSNLFDAIEFLGRLASMPISAASADLRGSTGMREGVAALLTHTAVGKASDMEFEADFLAEPDVIDDFGRKTSAAATALRYTLRLHYRPDSGPSIEHESLRGLNASEFANLGFAASAEFVDSARANIQARELFYLNRDAGGIYVRDDMTAEPVLVPSVGAEHTALSTFVTAEHATALAARRELQSWSVMHLQTVALRRDDPSQSADRLTRDGGHLPSALQRLGHREELANRLAQLLPQIVDVSVENDERNQRKTLVLSTQSGTKIGVNSISDGMLRMLALSVLALDRQAPRVLCIEEPENGIHPASVRLVVELFKDTVVDTNAAVDEQNPLRQIIFTTHAPSVVQILAPGDLLITRTYQRDGVPLTIFSPMEGTWRGTAAKPSEAVAPAVSFGALLSYLDIGIPDELEATSSSTLLEQYRLRRDSTPQ